MGYLLDNCLFDRLSSDIINQCQPYSCEKDADIDSFFHDNTKDNYSDYQNEMMGYSHCFYTDNTSVKIYRTKKLNNGSRVTGSAI